MRVDSLKQYVVRTILVTGNKTTKERVITREVTVSEGDTLLLDVLYEELERSRQNVMNTGLFNSVLVIPVFLGGDEIFVQVEVHERWYLWPVPIFELAETNFNTWWLTKDFRRTNYGAYLNLYNFRGLNETMYLKARFGYSKQFAIQYKKPFFDRAQRWGMNAASAISRTGRSPSARTVTKGSSIPRTMVMPEVSGWRT